MANNPEPWPDEIRLLADRRTLAVAFAGGEKVHLPAELLRVESPSAEVQGHGPGEKRLVAGKRDVAISAVEAVGNYAVRLVFDDCHETGIYGWRLLHELGQDPQARLLAYRTRLREAGLSEDR